MSGHGRDLRPWTGEAGDRDRLLSGPSVSGTVVCGWHRTGERARAATMHGKAAAKGAAGPGFALC